METNVLDQRRQFGLTQLDFDVEEAGSGYKGRPSFRDLMALTFQPWFPQIRSE